MIGYKAFDKNLQCIGASMALAEENEKAKNKSVEEELEYAKTIILDLLNNSDEYARQRAMDFLKEE